MDRSVVLAVLIALAALVISSCSRPSSFGASADLTVRESGSHGDEEAAHSNDSSANVLGIGTSDSAQWKAGAHYDYLELGRRRATHVMPGRIEVLEFFWYSCPHCFALEPYLVKWEREQGQKVQLVRVPIAWDEARRSDARLFYTLQSLGREDLHQEVFDTIHLRKIPLRGRNEEETLALRQKFAESHGIGAHEFAQAYASAAVTGNVENAAQMARAYEILGVPVLIVDGKYQTDLRVGDQETLLSVLSRILAADTTGNLSDSRGTTVGYGGKNAARTMPTAMSQ